MNRSIELARIEIEGFRRFQRKSTLRISGKMKPAATLLRPAELKSEKRMESLESAFRVSTGQKLLKVDLAYELLALIDSNPERNLSDPRRRAGLKKIWKALNQAFAEAAVVS